MPARCVHCRRELALGRFCPGCGREQPKVVRARGGGGSDPYVGRLIGERYEVGELISVGGMGRVHRGVQRSLDRAVAIKFIHPHLLTSPNAVSRFMTEARTASRLNHPNVVSVFDFGRTAPDEGDDLYIVMELLAGADLAHTMLSEGPLPIPRVVDIVRQTLLALTEAHSAGITHRDMKPENVFLGPPRGDVDHVKVIDFGLATISAGARITQAGQVMGTPAYMAPEQVRGEPITPAVDQYGVGVMLFELLTGQLPFEDDSAMITMHRHATAPRPDPRAIAPERAIPDALAAVCMRAMAIDAAHRFPDAAAMNVAMLKALTARRSGRPAPTMAGVGGNEVAHRERMGMFETLPHECHRAVRLPTPAPEREVPWRPTDFAWGTDQLRRRTTEHHGVALIGRPGMGCSFLAREIAADADARGDFVVTIAIADVPRCVVRGEALRTLIAGLVGLSVDDRTIADGSVAAAQSNAALALREVFGGVRGQRSTVSLGIVALEWAIGAALARHPRNVVVAIDDLHRIDKASRDALAHVLRGPPRERLRVILTSERALPELFARCATREIAGLTHEEATRIATDLGLAPLTRFDDDIEPLYLEHLAHWHAETDDAAPPVLADLLEARVQNLGSHERLALQSLAITGGGPVRTAMAAVEHLEHVDTSIGTLERLGFVRFERGEVSVRHPLLARVVLSIVPRGALESLHATASAALERAGAPVELRVHHALRGRADFAAFLLAERAASECADAGDSEGAIAILSDALRVARLRLGADDADAAGGACTVFARKLGETLLASGRTDEAYGVLAEALELADANDSARALLLEQLVAVARRRGRHADAERARSESLRIAERFGDTTLIARLSALSPAAGGTRSA